MARSRTIKKARKNKNQNSTRFLPDSIQAFIARRIVDIAAFCFACGAVFIFTSLLSYNSNDPSWNTASHNTTSEIHNVFGENGAWVSDILFQFVGIAAFILPLICALLAHRIYRRKKVRPLYLRAIVMVCAVLCAAIAMSLAPSFGVVDNINSGGSLGLLLGAMINNALTALSLPYASAMISFVTGIFACIAFAYSSAFTRHELASLGLRMQYAGVQCALGIIRFVGGLYAWVARYNDPDDMESTHRQSLSSILVSKLNDMKMNAEMRVQNKDTEDKIVIAKAEPTVPPSVPLKSDDTGSEDNIKASIESIPVVKPLSSDKPKGKTDKDTGQQRFALNTVDGEWELPSASLIQDMPEQIDSGTLNEDALRRNAELLRSVLEDFNIKGDIVSIHPGPVVTLYELEPAPGTKTSRVISLSDDIARSMSAISVRCAVVPGRNVIGIELPNKTRQTVYMKEMLQSRKYDKTSAKLPLILGKDIGGKLILADLAKMPHLLVAGTTGSGKSVAVNTMIMSLLYRLSPEQCRFIMIDPKMLELSVYDDIPHLLSPVVTEPGKAIVALKWAVHEMEERYRNMSKLGVRNVEGYNQRIREAIKNEEEIMHKVQTGFDPETGKATFEDRPLPLNELPYIVIIVDEFADLMLVAGKDVENAIQRLAQMARAAGLHLIMATQRPSVDVITGVVKANFPTRISFQVTSKIDSRTILGDSGAEQLLGMGDMLYMAPGGRITRVHGPFVSDDDVEKTTNFLRAQATPSYIDDVTSEDTDFGGSDVMNAMFGEGGGSDGEKVDELYDKAVAVITREGKVSTSFVQRHLQIGYNRAARIVEEMERQGIISAANATGKRQILVNDHSGA